MFLTFLLTSGKDLAISLYILDGLCNIALRIF